MTASNPDASTDVTSFNKLTTDDLTAITSFDDALALVQNKFGGEIVSSSDLGDGFSVLDNKSKHLLIDVKLLILSASFHPSDIKREDGRPSEFVSLRIVTIDGRKLIVNDGSTGIYEQMKHQALHNPSAFDKPMLCERGFRVSKYEHPTAGPSETFYLDTSL